MRIRLAAKATAIAAAVGLSLAACTTGGSTGSNAAGGDKNQTLHLSLHTAPTSFKIGNWAGGEQYLANSVYDTIFSLAPGGAEVDPGIAKSWDWNTAQTQLTLHIRDGMKFTDGTAVDADAVVASLNASRKGPASSGALATITDVKATDKSTVVISLARPDGALLYNLSTTAGDVGSPKVLTADSSTLDPVGSGPYILDQKATKVGDLYVLVKNKDYWNAAAYPFERVEAKLLEDPSAQQNAFRSGQIDILGDGVSAATLSQYPTSQYNNGTEPPGNIAVLWLADRDGKVVPALADQRVRQAINMVFDRQSIVKDLQKSDDGVTNQIFSPKSDAFDPALLDKTPYDVTRARELMAEAGYPNGFSVHMPSNPATQYMQPTLTQSLSEIGITVTWDPVPFQDFFSKVLGDSYGMFFMYGALTGNDAEDANAALTGAFNPFNSTTPELQKLLAAANAAPQGEAKEAYRALNTYLVDQAWFAPISAPSGLYVSSKKIKTSAGLPGVNLRGFAPAQ